jgi:hypothetical protein
MLRSPHEIKALQRVRRSRGSVERQTSHVHPSMGMPVLVPVPRSTMFMGREELNADSGAILLCCPLRFRDFMHRKIALTQHYEKAK